MASIGQLGGLTYEIPRQQQAPVGNPFIQQAVPEDDTVDLSGLPENLASRKQALADLIDRYAMLKTFSQDMAKKGINVFQPDYSQPGGGLPFEAFTNLAANVKFAKQNLINQQKAQEQALPYVLKNEVGLAEGVTPDTVDYTDPRQLILKNADYATQEANKRLGERFETPGAAARANEQIYNPAIARIDEMVANQQLTPQQGEEEKRKLNPALYSPETFAPRTESGAKGPDYLALYKNINDHTRGVWDPTEGKQVVYRGKPFLASDKYKGATFGSEQLEKTDDNGNTTIVTVPKKVKRTLKDKDGNVFFEYESPELDIEPVSNQPADAITRRLIEGDNAYGGSAGAVKLYDQLEAEGILTPGTRSAQTTQVFGNPQLAEKVKPKSMDRITQLMTDQWNRLKSDELKGISIPAKDGSKIILGYNDEDGVYIQNWKERGFKESNRRKNITYEDYLKILDENQVWDRPRTKKATLNQDQQKRAEEIKAKLGISY